MALFARRRRAAGWRGYTSARLFAGESSAGLAAARGSLRRARRQRPCGFIEHAILTVGVKIRPPRQDGELRLTLLATHLMGSPSPARCSACGPSDVASRRWHAVAPVQHYIDPPG